MKYECKTIMISISSGSLGREVLFRNSASFLIMLTVGQGDVATPLTLLAEVMLIR